MSNQLTISEEAVDQEVSPEVRSEHTATEDGSVGFPVVEYDWLPEVRRQLEAIAALPPGWDSHGSPSPDVNLIEAGAGLLRCLCEAEGLPKPYVNPTPSGGVQFEWESGDRYFELEVLAERAAGYLYRDDSAGAEEEGEIFEMESLEPIIQYIRNVAAVQ